MKYTSQRDGFTIIEMVVAMAIMLMMTTVATLGFKNFRTHAARTVTTQEIYMMFRDARNNTLGATNDTVYGVRLGTSTITRFTGNTYAAADPSNVVYTFEGGITATSSLVGQQIIFARITGTANASGTIYVRDSSGNATNTVVIYGSGLIEY